jgi:hypothetical protein
LLESILIVNYCWLIALTVIAYRLYSRPVSGLDPDDVDMIKDFMDNVRKLAASDGRRKPKC